MTRTPGNDDAGPAAEAAAQPAAEVYRARIVAVDNGRLFAAVANLIDLTVSPFYPDAWTEPRFHVLVGREGIAEELGVRTARTRRRARQMLAEVEELLNTSTVAEARAGLDLSF